MLNIWFIYIIYLVFIKLYTNFLDYFINIIVGKCLVEKDDFSSILVGF